ncbi:MULTISPECIES: hypothetical protein [unclassified Streptomyces]|uniref:hypothetical protein n=2 Tax=Streptomyces TaxID=1883 RepID=UPI0006AFDF60|nr:MULTISPECIES: hypothetical protein [unclassified Streptomyces]KOU82505.1 hypothetical protein ADK93_28875 [Streptomyces sp. XY58]KOV05053.1 hypothetical protein ADK89_21015 [Streptomyces sp. XY37]KOV46357.1 hypothetical protein ADK99_22350 [Streptomyces sp. MMG1064]
MVQKERLCRRPDGVSWSACAVVVAGLVGTRAWTDTSVPVPEFGGMFTSVCVALLGTVLACMPLVVAVQLRRRPRNTAAVWWAGVSAALVPAFLMVLAAAGAGMWLVCCVVVVLASCAATLAAVRGEGRGSPRAARAAGAVALVVLLAAAGSLSGPYTDYPGVWAAPQGDASLSLTEPQGPEQGGQYTLRIGTCTEQGGWAFDYPLISESVLIWLSRDEATACLPGGSSILAYIAGGTQMAPIIQLPGLRLTKQSGAQRA